MTAINRNLLHQLSVTQASFTKNNEILLSDLVPCCCKRIAAARQQESFQEYQTDDSLPGEAFIQSPWKLYVCVCVWEREVWHRKVGVRGGKWESRGEVFKTSLLEVQKQISKYLLNMYHKQGTNLDSAKDNRRTRFDTYLPTVYCLSWKTRSTCLKRWVTKRSKTSGQQQIKCWKRGLETRKGRRREGPGMVRKV